MSQPTILLSPKLTQMFKDMVESELERRSKRIADIESERRELTIALASSYTAAKQMLKAHKGPFTQALKDKMAEHFKISGHIADTTTARIVGQMLLESQLKSNPASS